MRAWLPTHWPREEDNRQEGREAADLSSRDIYCDAKDVLSPIILLILATRVHSQYNSCVRDSVCPLTVLDRTLCPRTTSFEAFEGSRQTRNTQGRSLNAAPSAFRHLHAFPEATPPPPRAGSSKNTTEGWRHSDTLAALCTATYDTTAVLQMQQAGSRCPRGVFAKAGERTRGPVGLWFLWENVVVGDFGSCGKMLS